MTVIKITGKGLFTLDSCGKGKKVLKPEVRKALDKLKEVLNIPKEIVDEQD